MHPIFQQKLTQTLRIWLWKNPFFNKRYSLLSFGGPQMYNSEALPFTYGQYIVTELADKLYNSVTVCFCASWKYRYRSQAGTERGLRALQHSLWPNVRSNRLAIWTKALWFLCKSMNFQVAGTGDQTTDPWITRPVLYPCVHHRDSLKKNP